MQPRAPRGAPPMRTVVDTNLIVSGLLWHGAPRQVLDGAREGKLSLFTSAILLAELEDVLQRDKFAERLAQANVTAHQLVLGFAALAALVEPAVISPVVEQDADDDAVLACAVAAQAEQIGSGDGHLLRLKKYRDIPILTAAEILFRLESNSNG